MNNMPQRNASDLIFDFSLKFKRFYQVYQGILEATREKNESILHIYNYNPTRSDMGDAVLTLKQNISSSKMLVIPITPAVLLKELIVK